MQFPENIQNEDVQQFLNRSQEFLSHSGEIPDKNAGGAQEEGNQLAFLDGLIQEDQKNQEAHDKKKEALKIKEGEENEDFLNDLSNTANAPEVKKKKSVREAVEPVEIILPRTVPEQLTWEEMNRAAREIYYIKMCAYRAKATAHEPVEGQFDLNARWSGLSLNQKVKRKKKGVVKQQLRKRAIRFASQRAFGLQDENNEDAPQIVERDPSSQEIDGFLQINLDRFRFNNDQEFVEHLQDNFALTDQLNSMEHFLERVAEGETELLPERVEAISKQIAFLKEIREWMDARLELIQDPYYVLLSSREVSDSAQVLEGLDVMDRLDLMPGCKNDRKALPNVRAFLQRYERVKNCTFNRNRFRDQAFYSETFRRDTDRIGDEKSQDIARRVKIRQERETREKWQADAKRIALGEKPAKTPLRQKTATMALFDEKRKAFMEINLAALHFQKIEDILANHAAHNALFEQAREMRRILADVSQDEQNRIPDKELIPLRARLALFARLRCRQAEVFRTLTDKDGELGNLSLEEWVKRRGLVTGISPEIEEQKYLEEFTRQNDNAVNAILQFYEQLKPGQAIPKTQISQAKRDFQKNLIFWETMKYAQMELSAQDDETMAFLNSFYQNKGLEVPGISKRFMTHLRGKSKEETEEILRKYMGSPVEQMQLEKEMADLSLAGAKHLEGYRINMDQPESFLRNMEYKLHQAGMFSETAEAVKKMEEIHTKHPEADLPAGYEEYRKELQALSEFAKDHIDTRMKDTTDVARNVDQSFLGVVDVRNFKDLKEQRDMILKDLRNPVDEQLRPARTAAEKTFAAADHLLTNKEEMKKNKKGEKQRVASADTNVRAVYQSYRLAHGIQEKLNETERARQKMLEQIEGISADPLYSSREELQGLRDLCINALSEYDDQNRIEDEQEDKIPEYLYYDLPTAKLKELARGKLSGEMDTVQIRVTIRKYQDAGLRREKEEKQPEWGEKEKNAMLLMGNLAGMKKEEKEDGEELLGLLASHAEVLCDMARIATSDAKKRTTDLKRYRELKQKIELGENLKYILNEAENDLKNAQDALKDWKSKSEEEKAKDKGKTAYLNAQVTSQEKTVASVKRQLEDWGKNEETYKKEFTDLFNLVKDFSYLEAVEELDKAKQMPQDVFTCMSLRMEGTTATLAKEIGAHLSVVVDYLVKNAGGKELKLSAVRSLLKKKKPDLTQLLVEAKGKIRASMKKAYQGVSKEVKDVVPFMFEDLNAEERPFFSELRFFENGMNRVREAYYRHQYDEKDKKEDDLAIREIEEARKMALEELDAITDPKEKEERRKEILNEKEKEKEAIMAFSGPDGHFMKQAGELFSNLVLNQPDEKKVVTLESLQNRNWAFKPDGKGKEKPGEGAFVRNVMMNYFDVSVEEDRQSMMKSMLFSMKPVPGDRTHARTNDLKRAGMLLAGLLRGAGPLMQKLMQGVPSRYLLTELSNAVEDMKSNLEPIEDSYVERVFQQMIKDSRGKVTKIKKLQSLGAASVGQAFLCNMEGSEYPEGKQVVIKILRPGVSDRIIREEKIMKKCAKDTSEGMLATYEGQLLKIKEELDLRREAQNCRDGAKAYEKGEEDGGCKSVHVMEDIEPKREYLVLDKAEGETFDRYLGRIARNREIWGKPFQKISIDSLTGVKTVYSEWELRADNIRRRGEIRQNLVRELESVVKRRQHLEKTTERWIEKSVFGDGFYHGDMHAGNLMANDEQVTILDYGNASKLDKEQVKRILGLFATAMYGDARAFLDNFLALLPKEQLDALSGKELKKKNPQEALKQLQRFTNQKNNLRKKLFRILCLGTESQVGEKVELALTELQKEGFQIPISLYSYVQSEVRLNSTLNEMAIQEIGLREDIHKLDHMKSDNQIARTADMMELAYNGASKSQDQEGYYRTTLHVLEGPDKTDFLNLLADQNKKEEFRKKYMGTFDRVNRLMAGKVEVDTVVADPKLGTSYKIRKRIPAPNINIAQLKQDYDAYLVLLGRDKALKEQVVKKNGNRYVYGDEYWGSKVHRAFNDAQNLFYNKLYDICLMTDENALAIHNGLLEDFGSANEFQLLIGEITSGKRSKFDEFIGLLENVALPRISLARELQEFLEKGDRTDKEKMEELFQRCKEIYGIMSERHETIAGVRLLINYDRCALVDDINDEKMDTLEVLDDDTEEFKTHYNRWRTLYDRRKKNEELPQKEEEELRKLDLTMRECRLIRERQVQMRRREGNIEPTLAPWFKDDKDGDALFRAYQDFKTVREKDMRCLRLNRNDTSCLEERNRAEKKFLAIYLKIAVRRLKEELKGYERKVPEKGELRDFGDIFADLVRTGGILGSKMSTVRDAVGGIVKGKQYLSGDYKKVRGKDLEDTIPQQPGEKPQVIMRDKPWSEEEDEKKEEIIIDTSSQNQKAGEEPKNEIILEG